MNTARSITEDEVLENLGWVRGLARRLVGAEADDLTQQVCLAALDRGRIERASPQADRPRVRAWLASAASYLAKNQRRADTRRRARESRRARDEALPSTVDVVARNALLIRVVRAVDRLSEPYRTTILLRYLDEVSTREIARRCDVSEVVVRKRLSRGLEKLRVDLAGRGVDRRALCALLPLPQVVGTAALSPAFTPVVGAVVMSTTKVCAGALVAGVAAFAFVDFSGADQDPTVLTDPVLREEPDVRSEAQGEPDASGDVAVGSPAREEGSNVRKAMPPRRVSRATPRTTPDRSKKLTREHQMEVEMQQLAMALDMAAADEARLAEEAARRPDGHHVERYPDGKTKASGRYLNGHREGEWSRWHANGKLASRGTYFAGKRHGQWSEWDVASRQTLSAQFRYGRREGRVESVAKGVRSIGEYRDGKLHGACRKSSVDGELRDDKLLSEERWYFGRKHGSSVTRHPNGKLASRGRYEHGRKVGLWEYWDANGQVDAKRSGVIKPSDRRAKLRAMVKKIKGRIGTLRKDRAERK